LKVGCCIFVIKPSHVLDIPHVLVCVVDAWCEE
jgi:hypothetical protein